MLLDIKKHGIKSIVHPLQVYELIGKIISEMDAHDRDKEIFFVIGLGRNNNVRYCDIVSIGGLFSTIVEARSVFRIAITFGGIASLILCHTHPSFNPEPSETDMSVTKTMKDAGIILGIPLQDHIIVAGEQWFSFAVEGLL